jgi:hypothetical protein
VRILSTCPLARVGLALKRFCDARIWRVEPGNNRVSPVTYLREILMDPAGPGEQCTVSTPWKHRKSIGL